MKAKISQVRIERASDSVFQILHESILTQVFRPGERLDIKDLTTKLGVSLTPVRDAINRLAAEGLIEIRPRSGTYVTDLSADEVADTFDVRMALECLAAEKMISRISSQHIEVFRELISDLEKPVANERERIFHERKNVELHSLIVELSGNRKLIEIYRGLNAHIKIARIHYSRKGWTQRIEQEKSEHRTILHAIEQRDLDSLVQALRQHIRHASVGLVEDIRKSGGRNNLSSQG
jgi:DNA-binding GntR family transcriptional regulator